MIQGAAGAGELARNLSQSQKCRVTHQSPVHWPGGGGVTVTCYASQCSAQHVSFGLPDGPATQQTAWNTCQAVIQL
jgi:hypothetical protein